MCQIGSEDKSMTFQVCTQMRQYVGMVYGVASQRIKHSLKVD